MPHKCLRCGKVFEGTSTISICDCGAKLFINVKNKDSDNKAKNIDKNLSEEQKKKIEQDIFEIIGDEIKEESPVVLDLEAINITEPGKYELDLEKISSGDAIIYKFDDGKYIIDIAEAFKSVSKRSENKIHNKDNKKNNHKK